ncbi:hypothetical protein [Tenacibaculum finnmarkense]|uniref:hypothetical protein n=1 Tax=Tenacibaculum finnmarkense TaxID=2781243 RepID=UPI003BB7786D
MKKIIKILILFFVFNSYSQKTRYLLFDKKKDSIITFDSGKVKYYYIDKNRFLITEVENNYNIEIDTVYIEDVNKIKFHSPKQLSKEGNRIVESLKKESLKTGKLKIISTYNELFECIYILEKISNSKFKRTRVWWEDITSCSG